MRLGPFLKADSSLTFIVYSSRKYWDQKVLHITTALINAILTTASNRITA